MIGQVSRPLRETQSSGVQNYTACGRNKIGIQTVDRRCSAGFVEGLAVVWTLTGGGNSRNQSEVWE